MKKLFILSVLALLTSFLSAQTHWTPIDPPGSSGLTATIIGVVEFEGEEQHSSQLEVGVFHGDECRGTGMTSTVALGKNLVFLTVYGISGEEDTFKVFDHSTNSELDMTCSQVYVYQDDVNTGSIPSPYTINFLYSHFEINASASPAAGGTVTGSGTYDRNAPVTLSASANTGYTFTKWTKDGTQVSTSATYSFAATLSTKGDYVAHFESNSYEITVSANPTAGGTVSGAGNYNHGATATLTATANTGYTFTNWTKGGTVVSTNATYSFPVIEAGDYVANFTLKSYEVTVSANPTAGGTVSGAGTYNHGATATLTATANAGYTFTNWTKGGTVVSTNPTYSFPVTAAGAYVANFTLNSYEVTASANPTAGGTVSGAGTYNHGATATLTATANTGYTFTNWTKGGTVVSTDATYSFTVTEAGVYVANFTLNSYEVTVSANPTAGGTVSGAGTYNHGATATLTATANTGYTFTNWTKGGTVVSTSPTYSFPVTAAGAYVANFTLNSYEVTVSANPTAGGTVGGAGTYNHGATATLTATANTGYTFTNWTKGGTVVSTDATYSFTVTEAGAYVANFTLKSYSVTVSADPTAGGTVSGAGTYNHGATATLTATANTGYTFTNWTKGGTIVSTSATYSFTVTGAGAYVAHFTLNGYDVTATANPTAGGTITGAGTYSYGDLATLTATANTGYTFTNWTKGGTVVSTNATYSFTVTEAVDLVANFTLKTYAVTVTANPTAGGTVGGAGTYNHGATATLTATANTGYTFTNWTKGGTVVSTDATYSFTVTEAVDLVANFTLKTYAVTVSADPTAGGTVSGAGTYNHGATATLTATATTGYTFTNWTKGGTIVSTSATYSFTVTGAGAYVAHFTLNGYDVTATANPTAGGTVTGAGTYSYGDLATLTATANTGYTFTNWTKGGTVVSTNATYSFTVTEAVDLVANFTLKTYAVTVSANPTAGGTVGGAGTYNHGSTATLTAVASTGYTFTNWTKGGTIVSTSATYSFTVTGAGAYVANFTLNSYEVTATANPAAGGTVSGAGTYNHGATATLTATANTGYTFTNWTKNGTIVSTNTTYSFTVTEATALVANFSMNSYEISVRTYPVDGGTVTGAGNYDYGETATLTATANEGYTFVNWSRNGVLLTTNPTYSFTVTEAGTYSAHFIMNTYDITVMADPEEGGSVLGANTYNHGETAVLSARANEGYTFVNWTKDGVEVSTDATYSFAVTEAGNYVAHFDLNSYQITAVADPAAGGVVTGAGTYNHFETCSLTATANEGYTFVNWTKDGTVVSTDATYSFTVTESGNYVAHFDLNSYEITATANPTVGGVVTGGGTYNYGETATLTATANTGYSFVNWTKEGTEVSTETSFSITVTEDARYVANFALISVEITAEIDPEGAGTVTGAGTYTYGDVVTMTATPNVDFAFVNWTVGNEVVSEEAEYTFTAEQDLHLVAHFVSTVGVSEPEGLAITVYPNPAVDKLVVESPTPVRQCEVYSITGQRVLLLEDCGERFEIQIQDFVQGSYLIRMTTENAVEIKKFVKN